MPKAIWNGKVIAEAEKEDVVKVEGNIYFPPGSLKKDYFKGSDHTSTCSWKGTANYFHLQVDGDANSNAAWVYRSPSRAASQIKDFVAFWKGVQVEE